MSIDVEHVSKVGGHASVGVLSKLFFVGHPFYLELQGYESLRLPPTRLPQKSGRSLHLGLREVIKGASLLL
jgi:hypothetical protein